jgi:hypothetical protein
MGPIGAMGPMRAGCGILTKNDPNQGAWRRGKVGFGFIWFHLVSFGWIWLDARNCILLIVRRRNIPEYPGQNEGGTGLGSNSMMSKRDFPRRRRLMRPRRPGWPAPFYSKQGHSRILMNICQRKRGVVAHFVTWGPDEHGGPFRGQVQIAPFQSPRPHLAAGAGKLRVTGAPPDICGEPS